MHSASATVNKAFLYYVRSLHAYGDFALILVPTHHGRKAASLEELVVIFDPLTVMLPVLHEYGRLCLAGSCIWARGSIAYTTAFGAC